MISDSDGLCQNEPYILGNLRKTPRIECLTLHVFRPLYDGPRMKLH